MFYLENAIELSGNKVSICEQGRTFTYGYPVYATRQKCLPTRDLTSAPLCAWTTSVHFLYLRQLVDIWSLIGDVCREFNALMAKLCPYRAEETVARSRVGGNINTHTHPHTHARARTGPTHPHTICTRQTIWFGLSSQNQFESSLTASFVDKLSKTGPSSMLLGSVCYRTNKSPL